MYTYIKKNVKGNYVVLPEVLTSDLYDNLGTTWEDYNQNKWVMLNKEQLKFREQYPNATVAEVWDMTFIPKNVAEKTLEDVKQFKIKEVELYDETDKVNNFYINGEKAWFTVTERNNYKQSIDAAKLMGVNTLLFFVGDNLLTISTEMAEQMLAQIQLYADQCFIVTKQHKLNIEALTTIKDVEKYNYKTGYPTMLNFEL